MGLTIIPAVGADLYTDSINVDLDKDSMDDPACSATNSASENEDDDQSCIRNQNLGGSLWESKGN